MFYLIDARTVMRIPESTPDLLLCQNGMEVRLYEDRMEVYVSGELRKTLTLEELEVQEG